MRFFSDNAAAACPEALAALAEANRLDTAYDGDRWSKRLDAAFSALFEREVEALWVSTGTAANSLALAALCPPYGSIVCHRDAHIQNDECGAPEFYTGGAKLLLGEGEGAKLDPEGGGGPARHDPPRRPSGPAGGAFDHQCQRIWPASTRRTRRRRSATLAKARGLRFHLDGARFANAVARARLRAGRPQLARRASTRSRFGFTKNGALAAEALILFDPALSEATLYRRKRAGHLLSKGRYLAAQILAMLEGDVWLRNARAANDAAARLAAAAGGERLLLPVEANEMFIRVSPEEAAALRAQGFDFYDWGPGEARLVTSWDSDPAEVDALAARDPRAVSAAGSFRDPRILLPFLLITLIWSSTWIVIKGQLGAVPPIWSVSYRFLISAAAMFAIARSPACDVRLDRRGHAPRLAARHPPVRAQLQSRLRGRALRHLGAGRGRVRLAGRAQCGARLALLRGEGRRRASCSARRWRWRASPCCSSRRCARRRRRRAPC